MPVSVALYDILNSPWFAKRWDQLFLTIQTSALLSYPGGRDPQIQKLFELLI